MLDEVPRAQVLVNERFQDSQTDIVSPASLQVASSNHTCKDTAAALCECDTDSGTVTRQKALSMRASALHFKKDAMSPASLQSTALAKMRCWM